MGQIRPIVKRDTAMVSRLLEIWEASVRATHTFLAEEDIVEIRPDAKAGLEGIEQLYGFYGGDEVLLGFLGLDGDKIEMLFVDAEARGQGMGRALVEHVRQIAGPVYVDVNEQNLQGVGFYNHLGFAAIGRSETDAQGRPFPILHMAKK